MPVAVLTFLPFLRKNHASQRKPLNWCVCVVMTISDISHEKNLGPKKGSQQVKSKKKYLLKMFFFEWKMELVELVLGAGDGVVTDG